MIVILFFSLFVAAETTAQSSIASLELNKSKTTPEQEIRTNDAPRLSAIDNGGGSGTPSYSTELGAEEFNKRQTTYSLTPDTTDLFGESIDMNSGSLSFSQMDISLPGNNQLEVAVRRSFKGARFTWADDLTMGDWSLDIPYIHTIQVLGNNGYSGLWANGYECSGNTPNGLVSHLGSVYEAGQYWTGDTLHVPGKVNDKLLRNDGVIAPAQYPKVTLSNWKVSCIDRYENGKRVGESFVAHSPDGLTYTFSKFKRIRARSIGALSRYNTYMLVTQVKDRFNNTVDYHYNGDNLSYIDSSDGRRIDFSYQNSAHHSYVTSATANGRQWIYNYGSTSLISVIRPDGKSWRFSLDLLGTSQPYELYNSCPSGTDLSGPTNFNVEMTHPNGLTGTFNIRDTLQGRSNLPRIVTTLLGDKYMTRCQNNLSLRSKTLNGPKIGELTWQYSYSQNHGAWNTGTQSFTNLSYSAIDKANTSRGLPSTANSKHSKTTTVISPDGSKSVYFYNRDYTSFKEGSLEAIDNYDTDGKLLSRTEMTLVRGQRIGLSGMLDDNYQPLHYRTHISQKKHNVYDQGVQTYTTAYNGFDIYGNPNIVIEQNSFNGKKRYTKNTYFNDTTHWLIGLPHTKSISNDGSNYKELSKTIYHSATGSYKSLPYEHQKFSRWYKRNSSYHMSGVNAGLPKKIEYNGTNRWVEFSNYKRGIAQTTKTPQSLSTNPQYAYKEVDSNGWVTNVTDFMGNCFRYGYDSLGRVSLVDPCNSYWNNTHITYETTSGTDGFSYIEAGMLKQTISKGNYKKVIYFDGLLRANMTKEWDTDRESVTRRFMRTEFDAFNRPTYQSKPYALSNTPYGISSTYDGLGRPKVIDDNTTSGAISCSYLSNNRVQINDNRGHTTTTTYLAYGSPETNLPTLIAAPHSVNTSMTYNIYDNLTSVSQGGITESRVYDGYQQLCKTVRPDVGNTAFSKNALSEVNWFAKGSSIDGSTMACDNSVSASDKATYAYDNLGNVKSISFGDSTPTKTFDYDKNSNLTSLNFGGVIQNYTYNDLNLPETERLRVDSLDWTITHTYNANGDKHAIRYPGEGNLVYQPNALGQPRNIGSFANNVTFHPNGQYKSYNQTNGCVNSLTQHTSGLPNIQRSLCGGTNNAVYNQYTHDANNNLTFWDDKQSNSYDLRFTYDSLDRLDNIRNGSNSLIGDMNYDIMGNVTKFDSISGTINYSYNSSKRLTSTSGMRAYTFSYDNSGNVTDNGVHSFVYNLANQMTEADGNTYVYDGFNKRVKTIDGNDTRYSMYSLAGNLMHERIDGANREYYYLGSQLVAQQGAGDTTYIHPDILGSSAAKSNSNGYVTRHRYAPFGLDWGKTTGEAGVNEIGYTGHKHDSDIGLIYMKARYYDPVTSWGRCLD
tara:strand:- start:24529 stop:28707 length:4179 start_codon:yes stop_codon:yes gene_type:complete